MTIAEQVAHHHAKADDLLRRGDAATSGGRMAEGKALLRECRRYRLKARALQDKIS